MSGGIFSSRETIDMEGLGAVAVGDALALEYTTHRDTSNTVRGAVAAVAEGAVRVNDADADRTLVLHSVGILRSEGGSDTPVQTMGGVTGATRLGTARFRPRIPAEWRRAARRRVREAFGARAGRFGGRRGGPAAVVPPGGTAPARVLVAARPAPGGRPGALTADRLLAIRDGLRALDDTATGGSGPDDSGHRRRGAGGAPLPDIPSLPVTPVGDGGDRDSGGGRGDGGDGRSGTPVGASAPWTPPAPVGAAAYRPDTAAVVLPES